MLCCLLPGTEHSERCCFAGFRAVLILPRTPDAGVPPAVQQGHSAPADRAADGQSPGQDVPLPVHTTPFASRCG